jgi:hypothetical protein
MACHAGEFFGKLFGAWDRAAASAGVFEKYYNIAGLFVRLRFAGPLLIPVFTPAFAHLERSALTGQPDLEILVWDCASAGIAMPTAPCSAEGFTVRGELRNFNDGRYFGAYQPFDRIVSVYDRQSKLAIVCARTAGEIYNVERATPFRALFGWFMRDHGYHLVHAAGIGTATSGLLLVGKGGAGKSNTALGCLLAGLCFAGDDFCAIASDPEPMVHSLYSTAKIAPSDWARPVFAPDRRRDQSTDKDLYCLSPRFRDRLLPSLPIRAVLWPRRGGKGLARMHQIAAKIPLEVTLRETLLMLPNAGAELLSSLTSLFRRVPCFRCDLGSDPRRIPHTVRALVAEFEPASYEGRTS